MASLPRLLLVILGATGVVVADCPSGWIGHRDSCYFFNVHHASWYDARYTCQAIHSRLVTVDTADENNFLAGTVTHFRGAFRSDSFWTEGTAEGSSDGSYKWATSQDPVTFTNWGRNEPNQTAGDCILFKVDRSWETLDCHHDSAGVICENSNTHPGCTPSGGPIVG